MTRLKLPTIGPVCTHARNHGTHIECRLPGVGDCAVFPDFERCEIGYTPSQRRGERKPTSAVAMPIKPTCAYRSAEPLRREDGLRETVPCKPCSAQAGQAVNVELYGCSRFGRCTTAKLVAPIPFCAGCGDYLPGAVTIDPQPRDDPREVFNASLFRRSNGELLMAYRVGQGGSGVHVCRMNEDLTPGPSTHLMLHHDHCRSSREDPRLFEHRGRLHVAFVGVVGDPANSNPGSTHVLYARLNDQTLQAEQEWHPIYAGANPVWEKSHGYFSFEGELFTVYTIQPHVVLHVRGNEAFLFTEHHTQMPWIGGHLRGGASPVQVGDEFWSFFHGSVEQGAATPSGPAPTKTYTVGVYCFEAKPPFRPTRIIPTPILWARQEDREPAWCAIVFPCGAVKDGDRWRVSAGVHDRRIDVFEFSHRELESLMVKVQ